MKKKIAFLCAIAIAVVVAGAFALDALKPGSARPTQVVLARMATMQANFLNFGDIKAKAAAGNVKAISANARSMMVIGVVMPTVMTDQLADSYPPGAKYFFKGGPIADISEKSQAFTDAAEATALASEKGDAASMDSLANSLYATCNACHAAYRGSK